MPEGDPNFLAYAALFLWAPVTFLAFGRLRAPLATMVCLLGAVMFLPEHLAVDLPYLPPIEKRAVAATAAFLACLVEGRRQLAAARPLRGVDLFFVLVVLGNVGTVLSNPEPLVTGPVVRQGLVLYDALALSIKDTLGLYLPFLLGRAMLRTPRDLDDLLRVLVIGGLVYSVLALVEIRLSPQLHHWIYGYHQTAFSMTMRFGGYRPTIFMVTGLATAMFIVGTGVAAATRFRARRGRWWTPVYLGAVLVGCKSVGALLYGAAVMPLVALNRRPRALLPAGLALMVLAFPMMRGLELFPTDTLVSWARIVDEERALSLWFRFDQDQQLLERARERPLFGWGTYDRHRIYHDETGADLSVTDGDWVIQLGTRGVVGFLGLYGMLAVSVLLAARRLRRIRSRGRRIQLAGLILISALFTVDLLPNGLFNYLPFFFAGAVEGLSAGMAASAERARARARRARILAARRAREVASPKVSRAAST